MASPVSPEPHEVVSIRMPSRLELLAVIDRVAQSLCERLEFDEETTSQVTMAVIEAGTNAIQHGHGRDPEKDVDVRFRLFRNRMEVDVLDRGPGFRVEEVNGDVTSPEHLLDVRGRGIFIMRTCMDAVEFEFAGGGTLCRLIKHRPPPTPAGD
jgi:anti-sigma regulatory factor (Ser/Thr protein kinase)